MSKPRMTSVPIYDGEDFERLADLHREVQIAQRLLDEAKDAAEVASATARGGDESGVESARERLQVAKDAYDTFVDEAAERATIWVLNSIGWAEYRDLLKVHPPRTKMVKVPSDDDTEREVEEIDPEDAAFGVNVETFPKALLTFVDPDDDEIRTIVEPAFATEAERRRALKRLSSGEFDSLWIRAMSLNTGMVADPKAGRFSLGTRSTDET